MELENDQDLREKILLNREKSFKEFFELNLQEMELDFKEEEKAIEKLKEDMIVLKEHVKNKIIEKVKNGNYFDNVFLIFDGDMEKIRHFIMNNINSQFLEYDISKEKDLDEKNLIEKISEKIKNKIDQIFEQNQEIKDKSLNKFKNEIININNEELKKIQTEQKKAHEENIIKANKEIDDIKKKGNNLKSDYENEINKNKENLKEKILNIQNEINKKINEFNDKINNYKQKIDNHNKGIIKFELEEKEKLENELNNYKSEINNKKEEAENIKKEGEENLKKINEELKKNLEDEFNKLKKKNDDINNKLKEENEKFNKIAEQIVKINEKVVNLKNGDIYIEGNEVKINNRDLSNEPVIQNYISKYNQNNKDKLIKFQEYIEKNLGIIAYDQVSIIEENKDKELEIERKIKVNDFGMGMSNKDNNNPVFKCLDESYEYNSKDMEILGKQIIDKNYDYFINYQINSLKKKIAEKKILIGNYLSKSEKPNTWNTVCMIPDGDNYIILYKNDKGKSYDNDFINFINKIGINKYTIKYNTNNQSNEIEKSSCIFSLKNIEKISNYLTYDKDNFIYNFENITFNSYNKEELSNIRECEFVSLYLKDIYEKIKKNKEDGKDINFLEIIDPCINDSNSEKMIDLFDIIYDAIESFITKRKR